MGGTHTAGSGNCMVRAADINVCGRAACSRRQREKRDAKNGGFWPLGLGTRAWESGARHFQSGQSFPKVAVACGDRSHGSWRVLGGDGAAALCEAVRLNWPVPSNSIPTSEPWSAIAGLCRRPQLRGKPGSTRSAVWHNLLADWESLPSTRGAPVRLPSPSTD